MLGRVGSYLGNRAKDYVGVTNDLLAKGADMVAPPGATGWRGDLYGIVSDLVDYREAHPYSQAALGATTTLGAGYLANKFLGNPIGGTVDAVTFGATNFRPDETRGETMGDSRSVPYSVPYQTGTPYDMPQGTPKFNYPVPPLDEKQIAYQKKRLMQQNAMNSMTLHQLDQLRGQGQQGYYS